MEGIFACVCVYACVRQRVKDGSVRACAQMRVRARERKRESALKTACGSEANIPLTLLSSPLLSPLVPVPGLVYVGHAAGCVCRGLDSDERREEHKPSPPLLHFERERKRECV